MNESPATSRFDADVLPARDAAGVWNFAFGSNLHPAKRQARARLRPLEAVPGRARDYRLAFNIRGIPWIEPSMASIEPAPGEEVHGLLLRLTHEQWEHLDHSEGAGRAYMHEELEVEAYDGRRIRAFAFRVRPERAAPHDVPPSLRYLTLIRDGAAASGLDPNWQHYLAQLPHTPTSRLSRRISLILIEFFTTCSRHRMGGISRPIMDALRWSNERLPWPAALPATATVLLLPTAAVGCMRMLRRLRRYLR
jgi:cation transport regulator ChaC